MIRIGPDPGADGLPPLTNDALRKHFLADLKGPSNRSPHTHRRYSGFTEILVEAAGDYSLLQLTGPQLRHFADQLATRCRHFRNGVSGPTCLVKAELGLCRALQREGDCGKYEPLRAATMSQHLTMLDRVYEHFTIHGWMETNPATKVRKAWSQSNRRAMATQRSRRPRQPLDREQVMGLLEHSIFVHQVIWFLMAKYGLRPGEAVRLLADAHHLDLKARILVVPKTADGGGKRLGNPNLPIDDEVMLMLERWLPYRQKIARPGVKHLLVNSYGQPWSARNYNSRILTMLREDCEAAEIAPNAGGHFDSKAFRRFFTKTLEDNGCPADWVRILRGDQVPGAIRHYWDPDSELHRMYERYGPKLA